MEQLLKGIGERHLVWILAFLISMEAIGTSLQGLVDGRWDHMVLWAVIASAMILVAYIAETIKIRMDP